MTVWREVEEALEGIIDDYERVNHLISFNQDDHARSRGLEKIGHTLGPALELGSGPGSFTLRLRPTVRGFLVCLDYSDKMLTAGRARTKSEGMDYVRAIFEMLPFREGVFNLAAAAYALRDSTDKERSLQEIGRVLKPGGRLLVVDIGKPNNPLLRGFFSLYMRYIVPIIGGLAAGNGYRNPWSVLYETFAFLPLNRALEEMMRKAMGRSDLEEMAFGGLVVAVAKKSRGERTRSEGC